MIDEDTLSQAAAKAMRAQNLLDNELLQEAFKALEETYIAAWRGTTVHAVSDREKYFLALNIVGKVRDHLVSVVNNGKLAAHDLKELALVAERKKRFGIV